MRIQEYLAIKVLLVELGNLFRSAHTGSSFKCNDMDIYRQEARCKRPIKSQFLSMKLSDQIASAYGTGEVAAAASDKYIISPLSNLLII